SAAPPRCNPALELYPREITSEAIFDITFSPGSFEVLLTLRRIAPCCSLFAVRPCWSLVTCHFGKSSAAFCSQLSTINSQLSSETLPYSQHMASWSGRRRSSLPARRSLPEQCAQPCLYRDRPRAA